MSEGKIGRPNRGCGAWSIQTRKLTEAAHFERQEVFGRLPLGRRDNVTAARAMQMYRPLGGGACLESPLEIMEGLSLRKQTSVSRGCELTGL